jgi:hypothetical protein
MAGKTSWRCDGHRCEVDADRVRGAAGYAFDIADQRQGDYAGGP